MWELQFSEHHSSEHLATNMLLRGGKAFEFMYSISQCQHVVMKLKAKAGCVENNGIGFYKCARVTL